MVRRSEVVADAKGDANGSICGVEAKEVRVLCKTEADVIILPLCKRRNVSCEEVPDADEGVQAEFCARLRVVSLGNRGILEASNEDSGADTYVRLQSVSGIAKHQIECYACGFAFTMRVIQQNKIEMGKRLLKPLLRRGFL